MAWKWAVSFTAAAAFMASPAAACMGDKVLFEDRFEQADPGWGKYVQNRVVIGGGAMKVTPQSKRRQFVQYRGDLFEDVDVCVEITFPELKTPGAAGLMFAYEDYVGFNYFWVNSAGMAGIDRWSDTAEKWLNPVTGRKVPELNTRAGSKVTLRVTLKGARATTYINSKEFAQLRIRPLELGGFVGVEADAGQTPATWIFSNFKITNLPR